MRDVVVIGGGVITGEARAGEAGVIEAGAAEAGAGAGPTAATTTAPYRPDLAAFSPSRFGARRATAVHRAT